MRHIYVNYERILTNNLVRINPGRMGNEIPTINFNTFDFENVVELAKELQQEYNQQAGIFSTKRVNIHTLLKFFPWEEKKYYPEYLEEISNNFNPPIYSLEEKLNNCLNNYLNNYAFSSFKNLLFHYFSDEEIMKRIKPAIKLAGDIVNEIEIENLDSHLWDNPKEYYFHDIITEELLDQLKRNILNNIVFLNDGDIFKIKSKRTTWGVLSYNLLYHTYMYGSNSATISSAPLRIIDNMNAAFFRLKKIADQKIDVKEELRWILQYVFDCIIDKKFPGLESDFEINNIEKREYKAFLYKKYFLS